MERKYAPSQEELEKMIEESIEEGIECKICGEVISSLHRDKKKRKFYTDCNQHLIIETIQLVLN